MNGLKDATEAGSLVEVIRRALAIYEYAIQCRTAGEKLVIEGRDGERREVVVT